METDKPVRTHSSECDKAGITFNAGEIPGGCIEPFPKAREMCDLRVADVAMQTTDA